MTVQAIANGSLDAHQARLGDLVGPTPQTASSVRRALVAAWTQAVDRALEDGVLAEGEEAALTTLVSRYGLTEVTGCETHHRVVKSAVLREILAGRPRYVSPNALTKRRRKRPCLTCGMRAEQHLATNWRVRHAWRMKHRALALAISGVLARLTDEYPNVDPRVALERAQVEGRVPPWIRERLDAARVFNDTPALRRMLRRGRPRVARTGVRGFAKVSSDAPLIAAFRGEIDKAAKASRAGRSYSWTMVQRSLERQGAIQKNMWPSQFLRLRRRLGFWQSSPCSERPPS
jgi:hypothetical protein